MTCARASHTDRVAAAADAFVFGYPLVLMDLVRRTMTAVDEPEPLSMRAPLNRFVHARELQAAAAGTVAADTLRSSAWLDLGQAPLRLTVPETHGRFYVLSLLDLWTNVFASVGARTTGTGSGLYAIAGPHWARGAPPRGALADHGYDAVHEGGGADAGRWRRRRRGACRAGWVPAHSARRRRR